MKKFKFEAKIQAGERGGAYVIFPYDVEKEFGTKGRVPVKVTIDGEPYTGSIMKYGMPQHFVGVEKAIREKIGKGPGSTVDVVLWKDESERAVDVPAEFKARMEKEKVLPFFESLSYTHRKEYVRWIEEAKREETRAHRLSKTIEMLKAKQKSK